MSKKQKLSFKEYFENSIFYQGEFYVKLCFTILFVVIFIISFFSFEGYKYFYSTVYADQFKGYIFQVHTIDVEQGDCTLIKLPNDKCMLIDTGEEDYSNSVGEYLHQFFLSEGLSKIDYLILTHTDSDHIGGAKSILQNFKVETILRPPVYSYSESQNNSENYPIDTSLIYDEIISFATEKGTSLQTFYQGLTFDFNGCKVEFLSPKIQTYPNSNAYSAVIMFTQQTKKFLLMGDAEEYIENVLIGEYGDKLNADVLKVGHHGSITSSSQEFIEIVSPSHAIISCGGNSKYFPNSVVVNRLKSVGAELLSTSEKGNFVLGIKNNHIIYSIANRQPNIIALIFSIILICVLIIWENPFKRNHFTKKDS